MKSIYYTLDISDRSAPIERVFLKIQVMILFELIHSYPLPQDRLKLKRDILDISLWSAENFQLFMGKLPRAQRKLVLDELKQNLPEMIEKNSSDQVMYYSDCLRPYLADVIGSYADFIALLSKFSNEKNRAIIFAEMRPKLELLPDAFSHRFFSFNDLKEKHKQPLVCLDNETKQDAVGSFAPK